MILDINNVERIEGCFLCSLVIVIKGMHMYTCTCYIDVQQTLSLTVQASSMVEEPGGRGDQVWTAWALQAVRPKGLNS